MQQKNALIISLNFRAAHVSHLVASYLQMKELGYKPILLIAKECVEYLPSNIDYVLSLNDLKGKVSIAIFWFPALGNIKAMWTLRHSFKAKIFYVFHEPIEKFSTYLKSGNSRWWTIKFFMKYYVALSFLALSHRVILPSKKAVELYTNGISRFANSHYNYLPLMYADERNQSLTNIKRQYISYIGGISNDHAFGEYVDFIYEAYKNNTFHNIKFLIASWRDIPEDKRIHEMLSAGVLDVSSGKPMSNDQINRYYASTYIVWNAYNRSTQSGVLAKSFMFGTPGLVMRKNLSEFVEDKREVIAIDDNTDFSQISTAVDVVIQNFNHFSTEARQNYERNYDYKCHNKAMESILNEV